MNKSEIHILPLLHPGKEDCLICSFKGKPSEITDDTVATAFNVESHGKPIQSIVLELEDGVLTGVRVVE